MTDIKHPFAPLQDTLSCVVFLIIVFFRPQGMFGRVWERA